MNDFSIEKAVALRGDTTVPRISPLGRATAISDLIAEQALASERMGRLTDKVATALLDANLFSVLVPEAEGGLGGTGVELFEAAEEIARADGSAGWCMAISNAISGFVCKGAAAKAREEVFGNGPVACWATLLPKATSVEVKGGFRVSGNFAWGSSSSLSRWVLVPARTRGPRWQAMVSRPLAACGGCRYQGRLVGCDGSARNRQHRLFDRR